MAVGVASTRAQGQATTSTVTAGRGSPVTSQTTPARASTAGVNQRAQRSAVRTMGARSASASLTRVAIRPRAVPSPVRVVDTCRAPPVARVPANTSAPGPFSAGSDSPVIAASSTAARP